VAAVQALGDLSDRELLERFVASHDESAFTVLIERHGPMVLGACRRALPNCHDAEDACQATFLVLARKAGSLRKKESLGSWLHGIARRVAAGLKREAGRRKNRERRVYPAAPTNPATETTWREVQAVLDEELERLPERYRAPLILCYLECMTRDEAGKQLGLSPGGLHGRLERGRDMLRKRLIGRGLSLSAGLFAVVLGEGVSHALSPTFVISSTRAAVTFAVGQHVMEGVGANVLTLTQEVLESMYFAKVKTCAAGVLGAVLLALAGGSFVSLGIAQVVNQKPPQAVVKNESDADFIRRISKDLRGTDPTPTEIHFFVANKETGKRQKLIDLFIQERQAKKVADAAFFRDTNNIVVGWDAANTHITRGARAWSAPIGNLYMAEPRWILRDVAVVPKEPTRLGALQKEFYKELQTAKDKADVARITQTHLNRLNEFLKANPDSQDAPEVIRQIVLLYESQGKTVEADAWRAKLPKEGPKVHSAKENGK
jgi:RNA polymerase sigma factor (sigma-70 family)